MIPLVKAELIALAWECIVFGIFTVLFLTSVWVLVERSSVVRSSPVPLFVILFLLYALATTYLVLDIIRAVDTFIHHTNIPQDVLAIDHVDVILTAKTVIYVTQTIIGDSFVAYRLFIVWDRNWLVLFFPALLVVSAGATGYAASFVVSQPIPESGPTVKTWMISFFAITLFTNSVCTALIAFRVWRSQQSVKLHPEKLNLLPTMVLIIESGAIYSFALTSMLVVYVLDNNGECVIMDMVPCIIGITASLIIARVALGVSSNGSRPFERPLTVLSTSRPSLPRRTSSLGALTRSSMTEVDDEPNHLPIQEIPIFLPRSPSSQFPGEPRDPHHLSLVSGRSYSTSWFTIDA